MGKIKLSEETRRVLYRGSLLSKIDLLLETLGGEDELQLTLPFPDRSDYTPEGGYVVKALEFRSALEGVFKELREAIKEDSSLDELKKVGGTLETIIGVLRKYAETPDDPEKEWRGWKSLYLKFEQQFPETETKDEALEELRKLASLPSPKQINIPKDLATSLYSSEGDVLEIGTESEKKIIEKYQKQGKLLSGSLEGLSGGTAFFRSFTIALARILNEQGKYYHQEEGKKDRKGEYLLTGIPKERIKEVFGNRAKLKSTPVPLNKEERDFPYILLPYEKLAKYLSKDGKISGGKDIEFVRLYINGGYREFTTDPKTGEKKPVKSSLVQGITDKRYPVSNGKGGFLFVPFVVNECDVVDSTKKDPEIGCLLRLTPQYSKTIRGYSALRGDTIQLIGGGRQKEITMDLISYLIFSMNATKVLKKRKSELLERYENRPTYKDPKTGKRRVKKLEEHFREAVQKAIDAKILLPGTDSQGNLKGYKEEINSGGELMSVFVFNPDYLKGEDIFPEEQ